MHLHCLELEMGGRSLIWTLQDFIFPPNFRNKGNLTTLSQFPYQKPFKTLKGTFQMSMSLFAILSCYVESFYLHINCVAVNSSF